MPNPRTGRPSRIARGALLAGALATACSYYTPRNARTLVEPQAASTLDGEAEYLKAHLREGDVYVLREWRVDEPRGVVVGKGERFGPDRRLLTSGRHELPLASVALFESNRVPASPTLRDITILAGVSAAITVACVNSPKACFGSCPTFYTGQNGGEMLQAEGFSTSISPSLEATDVDALFRSEVKDRRFEVRMRNEALETHVVRHAHVLAVPRPAGGRVIATGEAEFREALSLHEPRVCAGAEGDCRAALAGMDGRERVSVSDGHDLATRELLDLEFDHVPRSPLGIVIAARQTLLTTYLFYQTLAYMGTSASGWMAQFERNGPLLVDRAHAMRDELGGIEVLVPYGAGGWSLAGTVHEVGPLATDVKVLPLPKDARPGRVRLRFTRGHWRIDWVALARLGKTVEPVRVKPSEVLRDGRRVDAFTSRPLTTLPGDDYRLVYELPPSPARYELFLESRGYYLEWMRKEWMAEEDPQKVARILFQPQQALIDLAPGFKAQEATMEDIFWRSRYVRH